MARSYSSDIKFTFVKVYFILYVCLCGGGYMHVHTQIPAQVLADTRKGMKSLGSGVKKICKPLDVGGWVALKLWSSGRATVNAVNHCAISPAPKFTF